MVGRRQPRALVKGSVLRWARESIHLTIEAAAKRLKLEPEVLRAWESEQAAPSIPQLRKLADVYKRPLIVFYLPEPPKGFDAMRDFRRPDPSQGREPSPELSLELRRMHELRDAAQDLAAQLGEEPPHWAVGATLSSDPASIARSARASLGVVIEQQRKWRDSYQALRAWRDALENAGILVLHAEGRCGDFLGAEGPDRRGRIEAFCNAFVAELLVPGETLLEHVVLTKHGRSLRWTDTELKTLARDFSVSEEVVLRRLLELGRASEAFYRDKRTQLASRRSVEPSSGGDPYRTQVARLGRMFIRLVFSGLSERQLSNVDAATLLGVKVSNFAKLQDRAIEGVATA
jgi:transcriptional regulator with XRE-family HTH domain